MDEKIEEAKKIIIKRGWASTPLLQRGLKYGYARARRLLDELEEIGFISSADGVKPRKILNKNNL